MHPEQQLSIARKSEGASSMAVISVEGAALLKLVLNGIPIVDASNVESPSSIKFGSLLAPWPNRLAQGKYAFRGMEFQSRKLDSFGNAIHGLLYDRHLIVADKTENKIVLEHQFGEDSFYPFEVHLSVAYELLPNELLVTAIAENQGNPAPFGIGFHPYFLAGENLKVSAPFTDRIIVDENLIPKSLEKINGLEYSSGELDSCFLGSNEVSLQTDNYSISLRLLEGFTHTMLYRPRLQVGESLIAIEPMSCPANAFNTDIDAVVLQSGEKKTYAFSIKMS